MLGGIFIDSNKNTGVSVITCTNRQENIDSIFNNFLQQNIKEKELLIILNNNNMDINEYLEKSKDFDNIKIFQIDESLSQGDCLKLGLENTKFDLLAKFDDDDYYGKGYLKQALNAFKLVDSDVVGKAVYYIYFKQSKTLAICGSKNEYNYVTRVADSSLVFKRHVFDRIQIPLIKGPGTFSRIQEQFKDHNIKVYSTNRFNYLVNRNSVDNHTWKITEEKYLSYKSVKIIAKDINDFISYIEK